MLRFWCLFGLVLLVAVVSRVVACGYCVLPVVLVCVFRFGYRVGLCLVLAVRSLLFSVG